MQADVEGRLSSASESCESRETSKNNAQWGLDSGFC